ncbi:MAG: hypothetical protein ACE5EV_01045 [Gaiellales bacterium]
MRNTKAVWAVIFAVVALGILAVGAALTNRENNITLYGYASVPAAFVSGLAALSLVRRARFDYQRSIGRIGGNALAVTAKILGLTALVLSLTGALAIAVFIVLDLVA